MTSPEIWGLWGKQVLASYGAEQPTVLFIPAGESHKRMRTIESLCEQMAEAGAERDALLVAFGGGVVGDMTGFLAAIYMRGVPYVQVPTTLLAQVDSSVGGKTGTNLAAGKNLIGSFHHPLAVFADSDVLATLPAAELRAGLQESIGTELGVLDLSVATGDPHSRLRGPELIVSLHLVDGLDQAALDAILQRLASRWAADDRVAVLVDSLTVKLVRA